MGILYVHEQNKSQGKCLWLQWRIGGLAWLGTGGRESKDSKNTCVVVGQYAASTTL